MHFLERKTLAQYFDHAVLKSETTEAQVVQACRETREHGFFGLAVNRCWTETVVRELAGSGAVVVGVAGFPLGATTTSMKIREALEQCAICEGRIDLEMDMVANIGWIVGGELVKVEREIAALRREFPQASPLKVIIETPFLSVAQQIAATAAVIAGGAQFVKSATGFFGAPDLEVCQRLVDTAAGRALVKISGGVKTLQQAVSYIGAGANRLGSSASVAIMAELAQAPMMEDKVSTHCAAIANRVAI